MKKVIKPTAFILAVLFGVFMVIYGEADDSPGGQLLGAVLAVSGIVGLVRNRKKDSR